VPPSSDKPASAADSSPSDEPSSDPDETEAAPVYPSRIVVYWPGEDGGAGTLRAHYVTTDEPPMQGTFWYAVDAVFEAKLLSQRTPVPGTAGSKAHAKTMAAALHFTFVLDGY